MHKLSLGLDKPRLCMGPLGCGKLGFRRAYGMCMCRKIHVYFVEKFMCMMITLVTNTCNRPLQDDHTSH